MTGMPTPVLVQVCSRGPNVMAHSNQIPACLQGRVWTLRETRKAQVTSWELSGVKCRVRVCRSCHSPWEFVGVSHGHQHPWLLGDVREPHLPWGHPSSSLVTVLLHWEAQAPQEELFGVQVWKEQQCDRVQGTRCLHPHPRLQVWSIGTGERSYSPSEGH